MRGAFFALVVTLNVAWQANLGLQFGVVLQGCLHRPVTLSARKQERAILLKWLAWTKNLMIVIRKA
jgi:hypothetical protein